MRATLQSSSFGFLGETGMVNVAAVNSTRRRVNGGVSGVVSARRRRVYENRRVHNSVHRITEREAAKRFSAAVTDFSAKDLANVADKTLDAAKSWKAKRRCPHAASLINLARELPEVRRWLYSEIERAEAMRVTDPDFYAPQIEALQAQINELARRK